MKNSALSLTEISAEIGNKLQIAKTVLELLNTGKQPSKQLIEMALQNIEKAVEAINLRKH